MAAGDCERVPFRYEAQRATALRFGVRDLREDRWVTDWENHSFPTAKGHRRAPRRSAQPPLRLGTGGGLVDTVARRVFLVGLELDVRTVEFWESLDPVGDEPAMTLGRYLVPAYRSGELDVALRSGGI